MKDLTTAEREELQKDLQSLKGELVLRWRAMRHYTAAREIIEVEQLIAVNQSVIDKAKKAPPAP